MYLHIIEEPYQISLLFNVPVVAYLNTPVTLSAQYNGSCNGIIFSLLQHSPNLTNLLLPMSEEDHCIVPATIIPTENYNNTLLEFEAVIVPSVPNDPTDISCSANFTIIVQGT